VKIIYAATASAFFHIRDVDGAFAVKNRAVRVRLALFDVLLDHLQAFDDDALLFSQHGNDLAALAFFFAGDDSDLVAFFNVKF